MTQNAIIPVALGREHLNQLAEAALDYAASGMADSTRRAYRSCFRGFASWCASVGLAPLPADAATIALYLTARAPTLASSTLARHLAAIQAEHRAHGHQAPDHPDIDRLLAGVRRQHGRPPRKKRALVTADLKKVVARLPSSLHGVRDRALLLLGFAGALRRSELAALTLDGPNAGAVRAVFVAEGLELHLDRSKGDQTGRGKVLAIPFGTKHCAVAALQAWLRAADIRTGPVFRGVDRHGRVLAEAMSDRTVALIIKAAVQRAGFDPAAFAGHSLRSGMITSAARAGVLPDVLQDHARHARWDTTRSYIQAGERFGRSAAASKVGL